MPGLLSFHEHVTAAVNRTLNRSPVRITILLLFGLFVGAFVTTRWIGGNAVLQNFIIGKHRRHGLGSLVCPSSADTWTCPPTNYNKTNQSVTASPLSGDSPLCPEYFRWIHEDLRPWKTTGISKEMVERASPTANFRLVVLGGRAYVETFSRAFQTRDVFTLWGVLQLLRRYPGRIPDLELMFDCNDHPVVQARDYAGKGARAPPPLFAYCANGYTLDIVFPDWSFWGWPEVNIKPWEPLFKDLKKSNELIKWMDRKPYAFWKGNFGVASTRQDLLKCNLSKSQDWNARVYAQDWFKESRTGFRQSNLASQCTHRYKIYIEGRAWSVSEKYILACNSLTLYVKSQYYDFFTRGLMPMQHYWPIRDDKKCRSIKYAVDWGNSHMQEAKAIGNAASNFMEYQLKMDYVYDYMFHLLNEYSKLLNYKPTKPEKATEFCIESMSCPAKGLVKEFMGESMEEGPSKSGPCTLPPPLDRPSLEVLLRRKENLTKQVEIWEDQNTKL